MNDPENIAPQKSLEQIADDFVTPQRKKEFWAALQDVAEKRRRRARKEKKLQVAFWTVGPAFAALVLALTISTLAVGRFRYVTELRSEGTLPKNLQFNFLTHKLRLFGEAPPLDGRLSRTNSSAGLTVFSGILKGRDKDGIEAVFHGELIMTNAPGIERARKMSQILGARVEGSLIISGKTNFVTGRYDKAN